MEATKVKELLDEKGITQYELAKRLGKNTATVNQWFARNSINEKHIFDICSVTGIGIDNFEYLDFGSQEKTNLTNNKLEAINEDENILSINVLKDIKASAGSGFNILNNNNESFKLTVDKRIIGLKSDKNIVGIRVDGNSMSPTVNNNDIVIINTTTTSFKGDNLYVLNYADNLLVKRLQYDPSSNTLNIISDNHSYKDYTINLSENQQYLKIIGIVVTIITNN